MGGSRTARRAAASAALLLTSLALVGPPGASAAVTAWDASGAEAVPCTAILGEGKGGCKGAARNRDQFVFSIRTLAGDMPFGTCEYDFTLQIDGEGNTMMAKGTADGGSPCYDAHPCANAAYTRWLPWRGQIEQARGGRWIHRVDACLETCFGTFDGELEMELVPPAGPGRSWTAETSSTGSLGLSGWTFDRAVWHVDLPGLELRSDGEEGS